MIGVEMEASPKKLDRLVGDGDLRMRASDVFSETCFIPVWSGVSLMNYFLVK